MKAALVLGLTILALYTAEAAQRLNAASIATRFKSVSGSHATREQLCAGIGLHGKSAIVPTRSAKTVLGREKERLQQTYGGLEVVGGGISADYTPTKGYTGTISGDIYTSVEEDIPDPDSCNQNDNTVTDVAFREEGITASQVSNLSVKKNVYIQKGKACLTYEINFFYMDGDTPSRPCYFINACDLNVVYKFNNIQHKAVHRRLTELKSRVERQTSGDNDCPAESTTTQQTTPQETTTVEEEPTTMEEEITTMEQETTTEDQCDGGESQTQTTDSGSPTQTTASESQTQTTDSGSQTTESGESETTPNPAVCSNPARGEGGNEKVGKIIYGVPNLCLNTTVSGDTCILENDYVKVVDLKQSTNRNGRSAASYNCSHYDDAINGAYSPVLDAMHFGTASARMFIEWFNITALSFKPILYVHYASQYENAFWDGSSLTFGDGRDFFYPLVNQDVVAHELAHGFTNQNSDLIYDDQSGGINEAFSDITGEATEEFARTEGNDWLIGREIFKSSTGALRYFADPTQDGRSLKHVRDYNDNVDVHYSSGIINHAFYQMVNVNGMPLKQAFECFVRANLIYWHRNTTFEECACGVMSACYDLGYDHLKVNSSFSVVGITFDECPESSFMESLSASETLTDLTASSSRRPVYVLDPPQGSSQVTVTASGPSSSINMAVYDDLESGSPLMTGVGQMVYHLPSSSTTSSLYLRLSADSDIDISSVSMEVTYQ